MGGSTTIDAGHLSAVSTFVCGGVAGSLAKTAIAPMDRVKIMYQVSFHKPFSFRGAFQEGMHIVRREGWAKLWRGHTATLLRVAPYSGSQFMTYDALKHRVQRKRSTDGVGADVVLTPLEKLSCGATAGAVSVAITYPLDIARARLAVQVPGREVYSGLIHALKTMWSQGGLPGLYRGLVPTMLGIIPYSGLSFFSYHQLQQVVAIRYPHTARLDPHTGKMEVKGGYKAACGAVAGLIGQSAAYPMEISRRVIQTWGFMSATSSTAHKTPEGSVAHVRHGRAHSKGGVVPSWHQVMREVWQHHGGRQGLFKGLALNWIKGPIATSISFVGFDVLKRAMRTTSA